MKHKKIIFFLFIGLLAISFLIILIQSGKNQEQLEIIFFDVGQGDSIFINTPSNQQILIDGGPDTSVVSRIGEQLDFYDHHLDLVVLTHPHADHIMGLIEVLKRYEVDYVMYYDLDIDYDYYQEWEEVIAEKNITVLDPIEFSNLSFGQVNFQVIYPFEYLDPKIEDLNASSIVLQMEYQDITALLTGDATVEVEKEILNKGANIQSDILKVGHHGSKYSSSFEFLEKVDPQYAIIQSGEGNKFGHPYKITLNKLSGAGIEILRNDELGDIRFVCENGELEIKK